MKYIKISIPLILILLLSLFFIFHKTNNVSIKNKNTSLSFVPKINFLTKNIQNLNQNFKIQSPSSKNSFFEIKYNLTPYQVANNLGVTYPPEKTSFVQDVWQNSYQKLVYSNSSYFYTTSKGYICKNIYICVNNIINNEFDINTLSFKKDVIFSKNHINLLYYPTLEGDYIYKTYGDKLYYEFNFSLNYRLTGFSVYPINVIKIQGKSVSSILNSKSIKNYPFYSNSYNLKQISFSTQNEAYFIDFLDNNIVPIYFISGKADTIKGVLENYFLYVPQIKIK